MILPGMCPGGLVLQVFVDEQLLEVIALGPGVGDELPARWPASCGGRRWWRR